MTQNIDYDAVRRDVEVLVKRRKTMSRWIFLGVSCLLFVIFSSVAWSVFANNPPANDDVTAAVIMMSVGWIVALIFQFISALFDTRAAEESLRQQVAAQVIGKHLLDLGTDATELDEKRKRIYSLSDDGELEVVPDALPIEDTQDVTKDLRDLQRDRKRQS